MRRLGALGVATALWIAACGSDDAAQTSPEDSVAEAVSEPSTTDAPPGTGSETPPDTTTEQADDAGDAAAFPVTIEHKFGSTTIDDQPERVVSVGFNEHDFLLALGVTPVGLRDWYGDQPNGVWPWAQDELGDAEPTVIPADAINFELVASLDPDLIVGVWSGMTEQDYELLTAIAPTVAQPDTYADYGTPWQEQTEILGRATGRSDEAAQAVAEVEARFAAIRDAHPEWRGMEATVAFVTETGPGAYTSEDTRSRIMADLGFSIPEVNDSGGADSFYLELSAEDLSPLDVDVLVWVSGAQAQLDGILQRLPTRESLDAFAEGREVFAGIELTGAFSHGSPLSLDFALDALVPELEAAADGDPSTPVPSAVEVGAVDASSGPSDGDGSATDGDEAAAAAQAWETVFDSTVPFVDKAPFLADADELTDTVEAYAAAGDGFGGISLSPTDVVVDGGTAEITYDVNFGENPAYSDQVGSIALVDEVWTVGRDEFCAFMSSARVGCP